MRPSTTPKAPAETACRREADRARAPGVAVVIAVLLLVSETVAGAPDDVRRTDASPPGAPGEQGALQLVVDNDALLPFRRQRDLHYSSGLELRSSWFVGSFPNVGDLAVTAALQHRIYTPEIVWPCAQIMRVAVATCPAEKQWVATDQFRDRPFVGVATLAIGARLQGTMAGTDGRRPGWWQAGGELRAGVLGRTVGEEAQRSIHRVLRELGETAYPPQGWTLPGAAVDDGPALQLRVWARSDVFWWPLLGEGLALRLVATPSLGLGMVTYAAAGAELQLGCLPPRGSRGDRLPAAFLPRSCLRDGALPFSLAVIGAGQARWEPHNVLFDGRPHEAGRLDGSLGVRLRVGPVEGEFRETVRSTQLPDLPSGRRWDVFGTVALAYRF